MSFRAILMIASMLAPALGACSFEPSDGQFACGDGICPTGLVCVESLCRLPFDAGVTDAGMSDADMTDADMSDAGTTDAGMTDAGRSCMADFCADFDTVATVQEGWSIVERLGTGAVARVEVRDAPSAPAVFESAIAIPTATGPYNAARLSFQPSVPGHESATPLQRLSFAMKVTAFEDNPGVTLAGVRYGAAESYIILSLSPHMPTGVDLTYFYTGESVVRVLAPIELDTWVTLTVSIAPRSSTMSELVVPGITVEVDGVPTTLVTAPGAVLSEDLRFDVGLSTTNPEAHLATVQYDDVTIDYL